MANNKHERTTSVANVLTLSDSDTSNRIRAALQVGLVAKAFYDINAPIPTQLLTCWKNLLEDPSSDVRESAIQSLSVFNPPECQPFVGAVAAIMDYQLADGRDASDAATILCQHGHEKGLRYFAQELQSTEVDVRENAILTILDSRDFAARSVVAIRSELVTALQDPSPRVQAGAAEALWKIGYASEYLLPVLLNVLAHSTDSVARFRSGLALCKMGDSAKSALPDLLALEESDSATLRCLAVRAVARLGAPAEVAIPLLRRCSNDESGTVSDLAQFELRKRGET